MKQVLQSLKTGLTEIAVVPAPSVKRGQLLISTTTTLVSAGTERMLVEFGKAGWIEKARQQPDKVRMVLDKIKTDGVIPTVEAVFNKLDQPLPLGYCNVGIVSEVGEGICDFKIADRVVSNGKHAEVVSVPINLSAKIPDEVSDEEASFTILGAIALQGIRLANPTLGEVVVVTGLGLIGLLTVQLLRAHGCRVVGIDFDKDRLNLARKFGAEVVDLGAGADPIKVTELFSRGRGVDAVIITASTKSSEPIHQAALMCRKRGRIVLVGLAGLDLSRDDFFKKELTFQVSASYGPGRYDPNYEEKGQDYPVGFVRWTEQRNFEAVLDMMADGRLDIKPLISHRFSIDEAKEAYDLIGANLPSLGILLTYPRLSKFSNLKTIKLSPSNTPTIPTVDSQVAISLVGSGSYATAVLIPAFKEARVKLRIVASGAGVSCFHAGRKFGFEETTTDTDYLISDPHTNAVVVTTQHNSHAYFVSEALKAGKHVFVEKPLCMTLAELHEIQLAFDKNQTLQMPSQLVMVGFNRRFSPQIKKIKQLLNEVREQKTFIMTVNAGSIPMSHWTQDRELGGGRIIGEACHFIDLLRFLAGVQIASHKCFGMDSLTKDTVTIQLTFVDGSIGTIHYFSNGSKAFPKERLEVFVAGRVLKLDNYRKLTAFGWPGFKKMNLWRQDKGQKDCVKSFVDAIAKGGPSPIPMDELVEVSQIAIEIAESQN
jgi:predicted dehydrogenase/threonine dehydrogenase-like Zn-dependent dehydrogenase